MLDAESGAVLARTPVGAGVLGVDLSPLGINVYATSRSENRIAILDARSGALPSTIKVGKRPLSTAFSPDGLRAQVANAASGNTSVIDTAAGQDGPPAASVGRIQVPTGGGPIAREPQL